MAFALLASGKYEVVQYCYVRHLYGSDHLNPAEFDKKLYVCKNCGLCQVPMYVRRLMGNFIKKMWRDARDGNAADPNLLRTLPERWKDIVAESNAANASALTAHLPLVLVGIVAEYFG